MIKMNEYAKRRKVLMQQISATSIVILPAAIECKRNGDAFYHYRQNSDFYYLTGFQEPEAILVLAPQREAGEFILFNRVRNRANEIWDGPRAGQKGAEEIYLADQAFPIEQFTTMLPELLAGRDTVHYSLGTHTHFDHLLLRTINELRAKIRSGTQSPVAFADIIPTIHEMRIFKSLDEIKIMQKAIDITAKAHVKAMQFCKPGLYEYELEAELNYIFQKNGARFAAYNSIVGSGKNTCILHYITNNEKIKDKDLILIDAGAEYQNYAADITRTFPATGKFSAEQKEIYELVLASQLAAIRALKPGVSWTLAQDIIVKVITQGLVDLKILKGNVDHLIEKQAYFPFYMHRSGHWLGLDVHDAGRYKIKNKWRKLEAGMVFTVEPGIYISADIPKVHERWHNIGVRIEDNVHVTKNNCQVLSQAIPKNVKDIEEVMGSR